MPQNVGSIEDLIIMHLVYPSKFCPFCLRFLAYVWDDYNTQDTRWLCNIKGGEEVNKVHYGLCENGE